MTDDASKSPAGPPDDDAAPQGLPPLHERWWWTGGFRAVLGAIVVGYQWPTIAAGEAIVLTWVVAALGAAAVVWGGVLLLQAYKDRPAA